MQRAQQTHLKTRAPSVIALCAIFVMLTALPSTSQEKKSLIFTKPYVGFVKNGEYHLAFDFGIEQWEEGKRSTFRYQQWYLLCTYPSQFSETPDTWCSLTRTVFDDWSDASNSAIAKLGTHVSSHNHYTEDGGLIVKNADWTRGKLDLSVVYTAFKDESPTEVAIRLVYEDGNIYLNSFKAYAVVRGVLSDSMSAIEYRIPEYDHTMQVPVLFKGMKSEETRRRDELFKALSARDAAIWQRLEPSMFDLRFLGGEDSFLKKVLPSYRKGQPLTSEEEKRVSDALTGAMVGATRRKLESSGVSTKGQEKILEYVALVFR